MPDWLTVGGVDLQPDALTLATRLLLAWGCGWLVACLARRKLPPGSSDTLTLTLVLMCILIAMATQIIGDNVARAFSLVGALSIVRFRTAVPATRDVAFVLAAVVVGMAIGAGQYIVTALGILAVALATQFNSPKMLLSGTPSSDSLHTDPALWRLSLQVGLAAQLEVWEAELGRLTQSHQLVSAETVRSGGALELVYRYQPRSDHNAMRLIATMNSLPNVEAAATKQI